MLRSGERWTWERWKPTAEAGRVTEGWQTAAGVVVRVSGGTLDADTAAQVVVVYPGAPILIQVNDAIPRAWRWRVAQHVTTRHTFAACTSACAEGRRWLDRVICLPMASRTA